MVCNWGSHLNISETIDPWGIWQKVWNPASSSTLLGSCIRNVAPKSLRLHSYQASLPVHDSRGLRKQVTGSSNHVAATAPTALSTEASEVHYYLLKLAGFPNTTSVSKTRNAWKTGNPTHVGGCRQIHLEPNPASGSTLILMPYKHVV